MTINGITWTGYQYSLSGESRVGYTRDMHLVSQSYVLYDGRRPKAVYGPLLDWGPIPDGTPLTPEALHLLLDNLSSRRPMPEPVTIFTDGVWRTEVGYGVRGAFTRYWIRTKGCAVVAAAHVSDYAPPAMPARWITHNLKEQLRHFPGFDPTEAAFGSPGARWELVEPATATA